MVSVFTVYDRSINATRFVIANDEGFNYQTADTVSCAEEFECIELDRIILESHDWSALTCEPMPLDMLFEDDEWKMFKYCQFEFYKKDCQHCKSKVTLPIEWLPPALYDTVTPAARGWLHANDMEVTTDGVHVFMPDEWTDYQTKLLDEKLQAIKDFKQWFDELIGAEQTEEDIEECYNHNVKLSFMGREVELPFWAQVHNDVVDLLDDVIKDW